MQRLLAHDEVAHAVLAALGQVLEDLLLVPVGHALRQSQLGKALWQSASDKTLWPQVLEKKGQPVAQRIVAGHRAVQPVLAPRQRIQLSAGCWNALLAHDQHGPRRADAAQRAPQPIAGTATTADTNDVLTELAHDA